MNVMTAPTAALPTILDQPSPLHVGRRERINDFRLDPANVDRFNRLLARLGRRASPLNRDQLATAARELTDRTTAGAAPPCIGQRLRQVAALSRMVADPAWTPANDAIGMAGIVIAYVRGRDNLIPVRLQGAGRLDDAIVIETAWDRLAPEVENYLDFRRLRQVEATLRGCATTAFEFNRADWQRARMAEAALVGLKRRIREHSYLPASPAVFHIH